MQLNLYAVRVAAVSAALSPGLILTYQGGTGYCYFLAMAAALVWLSDASNRRQAAATLAEYKWYVAAMSAYPLVIVLQQAISGTFIGPALDAPSRLLFVAPIFALLAAVPARDLRPVQWGFVAGAFGAAAWSVVSMVAPDDWVISGRAGNPFTNPIPFGGTALALGFMGVISLGDGTPRPRWEWVLRLAGLLAGCYASYASESRGSWIAAPVMLWLFAGRFSRVHRPTPVWRIASVLLVALCLSGLANTTVVQERFHAAVSDFHRMAVGDENNSIGLRMQLWRASWELFQEHPVLGVGKGRLKGSLEEMAGQGRASQEIIHPHSHNEIFSTLAQMGLVGLAALLLLYVGSACYFWSHRHSRDPDTANAATMGLVLVFGTIIYGLTIDVFSLVMNTAFYALTTATLLGIIANRRRQGAA
ncbi:O-antigen ligase [Cupriavidus sp. IK-TO18]|uniref:O-antigen ligase family protein n=1 Tax=Cupriavidus sp. IK-TO18 TaxID=2782182 RepID=UPI0018976406|nr:O-antigen ligase family protein [Cupriavidus sp. IK-TO18]MBF6988823.1 O-antigen ligase family protein [Cupriavidus sp. IK-TO18]